MTFILMLQQEVSFIAVGRKLRAVGSLRLHAYSWTSQHAAAVLSCMLNTQSVPQLVTAVLTCKFTAPLHTCCLTPSSLTLCTIPLTLP